MSFGRVLGSRGGTCWQHNRDRVRFRAKSKQNGNVLCDRASIPLAPGGAAQIDATQQRSELFHADLKTPRAGFFCGGNRVGALFQTFRPDGEPVPVPVQNLEPISSLVGEQVKMAGERIQLEMIPYQRVQAVEASAHIAGAQTQIHAHAGRQVNHRRTASSTRRNVASSTPLPMRSRSPLVRINSSGSALATVF